MQMNKLQPSLILIAVVGAAIASPSLAAPAAEDVVASRSENRLEVVNIIGTREDARQLAGSAYVVDAAQLKIFRHTDINQILAQVPGVYLRIEDGFGLRPNIGIRGTGTERSGKITLMEDGVLIAPAPYSNPEAYYFPTAGRMSAVEVLKGTPLLRYGPYNVGGAINLISTPIPDENEGILTAEVGENNENRLLTNYGGSGDQYGWLLETSQHRGDGFQDIDRSNNDTGFKLEDYLGKFRWNTTEGDSIYQSVELKLQHSSENSDVSYLGLSDADFDADPNRRYGLTDEDNMDAKHDGVNLSYVVQPREDLTLNVVGYYNEYQRDWFKVDKIDGESLTNVIADANAGNTDVIDYLHGDADVNNIQIKHNNRKYKARGLQGELSWDFESLQLSHQLIAGARYHRDHMDRFQPVETFDQVNGSLVYQSTSTPSGSNNREEYGEAYSAWLLDTIAMRDDIDLTLALRYEDIETEREEFAESRSVLIGNRKNETRQWLPGIGVTWSATDNWQFLTGAHQGMSPAGAGAKENTDAEEATNYEAGFRFTQDALSADVIGFYSDYTNSIRNCSVANPCSGGIDSGTEQLGEAEISGVETSLNWQGQTDSLQWPVILSYTYTDAKISKDSDDGAFLEGDRYPYVPRNHFFAQVGVIGPEGWDAYLSANYSDDMCIDFECERSELDNAFYETDSYWIVDFVTHYQVTDTAQVYVKVDNILDEQNIVSRSPAGARPNRPRTAYIGLSVAF
jgi:Fe(3+) dicitrate transport protein